MFPEAKFIHLYRNPYEVLASTIKLYDKLLPIFSLQKWNEKQVKEQIIKNFIDMFEVYQKCKANFSSNELIEIKYENLVQNPLLNIKKIYSTLELENYQRNKINFANYIEKDRDYKIDNYELNSEIINLVNTFWNEYREVFGYTRK